MVYGRTRYRRKRRRTVRTFKRRSRRIYRRSFRSFRKKNSRLSKTYGWFNKNSAVTHVWRGVYPISYNSLSFFDIDCPIRLNSVYDPWAGLTGAINTVANGYDLYHSLYGRYCVTGVKAYVTLRQRTVPRPAAHSIVGGTGTVTVTPWENPIIKWGTAVSANAPYVPAAAGTWLQAIADPNVKHKNLQVNTNGNAKSTICVKWSARKWFGTRDLTGSSQYGAVIGANPSVLVFLNTWLQFSDQLTYPSEPLGFDVEWTVYFKTHWFERRSIVALPNNAQLAPR